MNRFAVRGDICFCENERTIRTAADSYLLVEGGAVRGIYAALPQDCADIFVEDCRGRLVLPGMTDLHLHAPQYAFRGAGMDLELMDWLEKYTFPEEAKYADPAYAARIYGRFAQALRKSTTTRACVFATLHAPATKILMELLEESGLETFVGKVNMDRGSPDYLRETTEESLRDTEAWLLDSLHYKYTHPILTPRFVPSCTDALMDGLGALGAKYGAPVQSHLSENYGEIALVKELCPDAAFYGDAYDRHGLFGGKFPCIMAHCVHSSPEERALMKKNGVFIAHSPESNMNIASGVAPVSLYLAEGQRVGLATDVAGGTSVSMMRAIMFAVQASKLRWRLKDQAVKPLTFEQAFYLATMGGGAFFGRVGTFLPDYEADIVAVDDAALASEGCDLRTRLERAVYLAEECPVTAKYVAGRRVL